MELTRAQFILALIVVSLTGLDAYAYTLTDSRCEGNPNAVFYNWRKCEQISCSESYPGGGPNASLFGCGVAQFITEEQEAQGCEQRLYPRNPWTQYPDCCKEYIWCPTAGAVS